MNLLKKLLSLFKKKVVYKQPIYKVIVPKEIVYKVKFEEGVKGPIELRYEGLMRSLRGKKKYEP